MNHSKTKLDNGLRVILAPESGSLAVTILVLVEAGSKYEKKENNGISHFLEHMCFKGTKNRPKAIDISGELDSIGAQYNAFTGHEFTGYYAKVASNYFDKALDIVSDLYLNPLFNENEIEKEKGVISEEINMYEDLPQHKVQDLIMEVLYGDQPSGWSIAGDKETVRKFNKEDFLNYRGKHYVPDATTVVIAGNFDEKYALEQLKEKFREMPHGNKEGKLPVDDNFQKTADALIKNKESDQTHLVLAVRSFGANDERNYTVDVISQILGGGMSSRLFQKLREEMGVVYYVRAFNENFTDHGFMEASAGVDNSRVKEVIPVILAEFKKIAEEKVDEAELNRTKECIVGNLYLGLETSDSIANYYGAQEMLREKIINPEEYAKKIKEVTSEKILEVAKEIFDDKNLNLALIGPFKEKEVFADMLKI